MMIRRNQIVFDALESTANKVLEPFHCLPVSLKALFFQTLPTWYFTGISLKFSSSLCFLLLFISFNLCSQLFFYCFAEIVVFLNCFVKQSLFAQLLVSRPSLCKTFLLQLPVVSSLLPPFSPLTSWACSSIFLLKKFQLISFSEKVLEF